MIAHVNIQRARAGERQSVFVKAKSIREMLDGVIRVGVAIFWGRLVWVEMGFNGMVQV